MEEALARSIEYDLQTIEVMKHVLQPDSSCVDVGAHVGTILSAMTAIAPHGNHYAFEPLPRFASRLRHNFPSVTVHKIALSDETGITEFQCVKNSEGYSGMRLRPTPFEPDVQTIMVDMKRLDDVIPEEIPIAFIKIDVEGAEGNVFRGGLETIKRNKPIIVFECGRRALATYGFSFRDIYELLVDECGLDISIMKRWLNEDNCYSKLEFIDGDHKDFMWIAY